MSLESFNKEIIEKLKQKHISKQVLSKLKVKLCAKHKLKQIPTDIQILLNTPEKDINKIRKNLITKPTRSISGVAVIAIMTKPYKCPHGKCDMCPGGPDSEFGNVPQSYTGKEPATMRAIRNKYDPYLQVFNRLEQYIVMGHMPDKAELIIMGGTFPSLPKIYQKNFIKLALKAMNDFSKLFFKNNDLDIKIFKSFFALPADVSDPDRAKLIRKKLLELKNKSKSKLEKEQKRNEKSKIRCVGLTIETRPDYGGTEQGNFMLSLGATRIELGIESVYNETLKKINRGHDLNTSIKSIRKLKDLGFKLNFHYMPGLPDTSLKKDLAGMKSLFTNPDFKPDMLKIYPCMVTKGTNLYKKWKSLDFTPLTTMQAAHLIAEFKRFIPPYCRVMRVQRDIPSYQIEAGVDRTNLRQYVHQICRDKKIKCKCIRCREIGRAKKTVILNKPGNKKTTGKIKNAGKIIGKISINIINYKASCGTEFFISAEDRQNNAIIGFSRLRFPSESLRKEITKDSALIRELHVYGSALAVGSKSKKESQHRGWGQKLLKTAEAIARKNKKKKIIIISGIGTREYYRKLGYKKQGPYMIKYLA